jgi:pimeloyl-ACP methyl ester carboxylesterase
MTPDGARGLGVDLPTREGDVHVRVWPAQGDQAATRPVLLALHGWTDSGAVFEPLYHALGRRWTIVAPDAPAHGRTAWRPSEVFSVPDHAAGVERVVRALPGMTGATGSAGVRPRPVVVLGHSMGALTAARVAAACPDVVAHLVLEDPARSFPRRTPSSPSTLRWVTSFLAVPAGAERLAEAARRCPGWPADELPSWVSSKEELDLAHLRVRSDWGEPIVALLSEVSCPVTVVRGELASGGIVSATAARRMVAACRGGAEVVALDAGHNLRREVRDPFIAVLASALGRYEVA